MGGTSKGPRGKGKRGEREWRDVLRRHGVEAHRGRQYQGGDDSPDVVHQLGPYHFEVKRVERFGLHAAMAQANEEAGNGILVPIVVSKRNRGRWLAHLDAEQLVELVRAAEFAKREAGHASWCESYKGSTGCDCGLDGIRASASCGWRLEGE